MMRSLIVKKICHVNETGKTLIKTTLEKLVHSTCALDQILKVSRTIADLAGSEDMRIENLAEAIQYLGMDRGWHTLTWRMKS